MFLNNKEIGRRSITAGLPDAPPPIFALPPLPEGTHAARLETPDDHLSMDNAFHFLIRVRDEVPALCVGSREDTLFVRTALRAAAGQPGAAKVIAADQLANENLSAYPCVFLCNALPLPGQALSAVERYVEAGGLAVIFPGLGASTESYSAWTSLPGMPAAMIEIPKLERDRTLTWASPRHPLIDPLRQGAAVPELAVRRALVWDKLPDEEFRLISMGANEAFLLDRPHGEGHVLMFAVAADRTWSDFPLSPFFLPIISQCVDYGSGLGSSTPFVLATESLSLSQQLPELDRGTELLDPAGNPTPVRSSVVEGRTELVAEDLTQPGVYTTKNPATGFPIPALAVNLIREESNLAPIAADEIIERVKAARLHVATDLDTLMQLVEEHRVGRTYGEYLLWIAFLLIAVEFLYANFRVRSKPRLSEQLNIDEAGQLRGHASTESS